MLEGWRNKFKILSWLCLVRVFLPHQHWDFWAMRINIKCWWCVEMCFDHFWNESYSHFYFHFVASCLAEFLKKYLCSHAFIVVIVVVRRVILHLRLKLNNGFGINSSSLIASTQQQAHAIHWQFHASCKNFLLIFKYFFILI